MKKLSISTLVKVFFTIIIVSFFLGGLLKPQCILVTDARVKNLENNFNHIISAIYNYQERYHALPGDKNGDGRINGAFDSTKHNEESRLFWLHLRQAGLIDGSPNDQQQPTHRLKGLIGVSTNINTGKESGILGLFVGFSRIPGDVALMIESRSDDNKPNSGSVQAHQIVAGEAVFIESYLENGWYNLYFAL